MTEQLFLLKTLSQSNHKNRKLLFQYLRLFYNQKYSIFRVSKFAKTMQITYISAFNLCNTLLFKTGFFVKDANGFYEPTTDTLTALNEVFGNE